MIMQESKSLIDVYEIGAMRICEVKSSDNSHHLRSMDVF